MYLIIFLYPDVMVHSLVVLFFLSELPEHRQVITFALLVFLVSLVSDV